MSTAVIWPKRKLEVEFQSLKTNLFRRYQHTQHSRDASWLRYINLLLTLTRPFGHYPRSFTNVKQFGEIVGDLRDSFAIHTVMLLVRPGLRPFVRNMRCTRPRRRSIGALDCAMRVIHHIFFGGRWTASCVVAKNPACHQVLLPTVRMTFSNSLKLKSRLSVHRQLATLRQLEQRPVDKPLEAGSHLAGSRRWRCLAHSPSCSWSLDLIPTYLLHDYIDALLPFLTSWHFTG